MLRPDMTEKLFTGALSRNKKTTKNPNQMLFSGIIRRPYFETVTLRVTDVCLNDLTCVEGS